MKNEVYKEFADVIANARAEEQEGKGNPVIDKEAHIEKESTQILDALMVENKKAVALAKESSLIMVEELKLLPLEKQKQLGQEFVSAMKNLEGYEEAVPLEEESLKETLGLSVELLSWIYGIGHKLFKEEQYKKAEGIFSVLVLLNPMVCDYWMAIGFTHEALDCQEKALYAFSYASLLDFENPASRYKSAEVYFKLEKFEDALVELEILEEIITKQNLDNLRIELKALKNKVQVKLQ
jgi:tetratricopeptide (TPR) repeat protein